MKTGVYFIAGTGTGVGKTFVAASIAYAFRIKGADVGVMKPVESGCRTEGKALMPADALLLKEASGSGDPLELICPYRFRMPLAPNIAARHEGMVVDFGNIRGCLTRLKGTHDVVVVEGAGGLLSPLTDDLSCADLALFLNAQLVVVALNGLGVINQALLTIEAARSRAIPIKGVVLNSPAPHDPEDPSLDTNAGEIERLGRVDILGTVPFLAEMRAREKKGAPPGGGALCRFFEEAASYLDMTRL